MTESSLRHKAHRCGLGIRKSRNYDDSYMIYDLAHGLIYAGSPAIGDLYTLTFDEAVDYVTEYAD